MPHSSVEARTLQLKLYPSAKPRTVHQEPVPCSPERPMLTQLTNSEQKSVAVIGGGVAGMSAACALAEAGFRVQLVERRGYLGGRASSYLHPGVNEIIDNCQHVLFGCCTNLIGFYKRIGVQKKIHWTTE